MAFEGKYYNGYSSKGIPALITLEPDHIRIAHDTGEEQGAVTWEVEGIHPSEFNDSITMLRYGRFPHQSISVVNQGFQEALQRQYRDAAFLKSNYRAVLNLGLGGIAMLGVLFLSLVVVFLVWGVPALADRAALFFPKQYERQLGEQLYGQLIQGYTVNDAKTAALNGYLDGLQTEIDYPVTAVVVSDEEVNAFALPGGFVVVHEGILNKMERHEELAALMGHELAHVQNRHSLRAITRSLSYYMLASLMFGDVSGVTAVIVDNASALRNLEYSRSLEQQADEEGLQLLRQNHLNPEGMVWLLERLQNADGPEMLAFLSTHPNTNERISTIAQKIGDATSESRINPELELHWKQLKAR
jgi:beta-barrel assembly-enhancing protease